MNNKHYWNRQVKALALIIGAALLAAGCNQHGDHAHGSDNSHTSPSTALSPIAITHFSDRTELFVEFEPLVVGQESAVAAHMSYLADYKAVNTGKLSVTLSGGNQPEEKFIINAPKQAGIFRPVVKPKYLGERIMTFNLETPQFTANHNVGKVVVYADHASALKAQANEKPDAPGAIAYLKEQQWKTNFGLAVVGKHELRESIAATGILRASSDRDAQLTAVTTGQIVAANDFPRVGMAVQKGQVLAYLVPRLGGETDVASLDLAAQKARLTAQFASRDREHLESLFKQEAVPEKRVIASRRDENIALAELASAERRVGQYRNGSQGLTGAGVAIHAPITGTIAEVSVAMGGFVNEGVPIFHIANTDRLWLEVRVAESDIGRIGQPTGAAFRVDGFDQEFEIIERKGGRVVGFGNAIDLVTRTAPLLFEFPNPDKRLRIGMAARANVFAGKLIDVVAVPASAVIDDNGQPVVYVQRTGEAFERRPVQLGLRDGDWIEVKSGVAAGERVVSNGAYQVRLAATTTAAIGEGHVH